MKRETPRYRAERMRSNDRFWMVSDTHRDIHVRINLTESQAVALANERNGQ